MKSLRGMVLGLCFSVAAGCGGQSLPGDDHQGLGTDEKTLWPLSMGSRWKYRITDDVRGTFEKHVQIAGVSTIPGTSLRATLVRSVQPHLEELSWQLERDGLVFRAVEEDRRGGVVVRQTAWDPATVKSLAKRRDSGWTHTASVHELVRGPDGFIIDEKDKTYVWRVLATEVDVQTPAGVFKAIKVQRDRPDKTGKERIYWLVPGVGKVREEGERTEELLEYLVN